MSVGRGGAGRLRVQCPVLALRWVEGVLQLKNKSDVIWEMAFKNYLEIGSGLNEVINDTVSFLEVDA